ncbi:MAG: transposase [Anaerolineales bacterium]|nr:transposase [Anaerolineales bacterium]
MESELRAYHQLFAERFVLRERRPAAARRRAAQSAVPAWEPAELWLDEGAVTIHQAEVAKTLGHPAGGLALVTDMLPERYPGFDDAGRVSAELWPGPAAVYLIYASPLGATLLDRRLYLPPAWFGEDQPRPELENAVPAWVTFKTGPALGTEMIQAVLAAGQLPVRCIALDEAYCQEFQLLDDLHRKAQTYLITISRHQRFWFKPADDAWQPLPADRLAARLPASAWYADTPADSVAVVRAALDRHGQPGPEGWLIIRRPAESRAVDEWRFFQTNAPAAAPISALALWTAWQAHPQAVLEACQLDAAAPAPGWAGWHHHTALTMLAHHFLVRLQSKFGAAAPALSVPQARQVLQCVLPQAEFDITLAVDEIKHIQLHNLHAYFKLDAAGGAEPADPYCYVI